MEEDVCRVNRLDGDDKEYGYIVDYKDLFHRLEGAISDYTSGAFDGYEEADVKGLLTDRLEKGKERLEEARETVKAICEPVLEPRGQNEYRYYFCGDPAIEGQLQDFEARRIALYKAVASRYLEVSGLSVEIVRKKIKNLHLAVYPPDGTVKGVPAGTISRRHRLRVFVSERFDLRILTPKQFKGFADAASIIEQVLRLTTSLNERLSHFRQVNFFADIKCLVNIQRGRVDGDPSSAFSDLTMKKHDRLARKGRLRLFVILRVRDNGA